MPFRTIFGLGASVVAHTASNALGELILSASANFTHTPSGGTAVTITSRDTTFPFPLEDGDTVAYATNQYIGVDTTPSNENSK